jgi:beta-lactamase class A
MGDDVNAIISAHPEFDTGVAVQDLNSGKTYTYGENQPYIAASVSKVLTATLYLHEVEQDEASLSDQVGNATAQYQIQQLIENSDNDAWQALNDLLGHDELKAYADQIGLDNYDPDENTLTVDTIATLYGKLYKNELLNKSDTKLLLSYMKNANETEFISASVPDSVTVYHKAGWLDDRIHDAAIIDNGKHPYVLVIFTKAQNGTYDTTVGQQVFTDITKATTKQFLQ